ncbi:MAG: hypothetical protein HYV93_00530 [Candidatus Rokubacteria bacterium]|nr:hypothetical protein [Candidatus Rokubacteria bacterium]
MAAHGFVAVVGARVLPEQVASQVAEVVGFFLRRGWGIGSGGARGADAFALQAVLGAGPTACARSVVFLPGSLGGAPDGALGTFAGRGGRVVPGSGVGRTALLGRSRRLARASAGVVAFLWGPSRGSVFTLREAIRSGKPAAVVLAGGGAALPAFSGGAWAPCSIGPVAAFRWVPAPESREPDAAQPARRPWLARVFQVPEGEPTHALLEHISSLSQGDRLWFERGVLAGDTVVVAHEALSDTPAFLATRRLMARFRCTAREGAGLAELFLALDAGPAVVAHYEAEARQRSAAVIIEDLAQLVARLALAEAVPDEDALDHADCLADRAVLVSTDGQVAQRAGQSEGASAQLAWHALGTVQSERATCPVCRAVFEADDEAAELPICPECGTRDTWEARQGGRFRGIVGAIDGCPSIEELAALGKRLYALALSHDQAGVAWSHYHLRKQVLEAVPLGQPAQVLLAEVEHASRRFLPRLGACLYRVQRIPSIPVSAPEWRRIWSAYRARRGAVSA